MILKTMPSDFFIVLWIVYKRRVSCILVILVQKRKRPDGFTPTTTIIKTNFAFV